MKLVSKIALSLCLVSASAFGGDVSKEKQDAEKLVTSALPFAQEMLSNHGEFYPYGVAMRPDGQVEQVGAYNGEEHPEKEELVELLRNSFRKAAAEQEYIATAIVFDARMIPPGTEEKTDAVAIAIDHRDDFSVVVLFPYQLTGSGVEFQSPFTMKGAGDIFL